MACLAVARFFGGEATAAPPPQMRIESLSELGSDVPYPYDSKADADRAVADATARAAAGGKLLLIDLGGNWCVDCRILAGLMQRPELKAFVDAHYVVVMVDVGRIDRNLHIPARYGITWRPEGVPAVLIVDPDTGALLDRGHVSALEDAGAVTPQGIADWLAQWTK